MAHVSHPSSFIPSPFPHRIGFQQWYPPRRTHMIGSSKPVALVDTRDPQQQLHDLQEVNAQLLVAGLCQQNDAEQLRLQIDFTTTIMTSLGEGVYVIDMAGQCIYLNPAAEQLAGWRMADLQGRSLEIIFLDTASTPASDHAGEGIASVLAVLRTGEVQRQDEAQLRRRDGGVFAIAYSAAPMRMDGQVVGAVISVRDMTQAQQLRQLREEYLALVSHDLRAPLSVMMGYAQLLVRRLEPHGLTREIGHAQMMLESGLRMNAMIQDILDHGQTTPQIDVGIQTPTDLALIVQQMIDQTVQPDQRDRIVLDAPPTLPITINQLQISRVLVNLLTNALKFSSPEQMVHIQVRQQAAEAQIRVTDQGIGMAPDELLHAFESGYRAKDVDKITGHGLGLYSSRLIVEAHGGQIWVESAVGQGTTVTLTLPIR
ncbi:HAMP domain-containing histidine kinase [Chloroflexia bacterium SDU3-3]|nr:HAMP domain-containing histidine kinase [Chloroflexia bacterium SDU3-3]